MSSTSESPEQAGATADSPVPVRRVGLLEYLRSHPKGFWFFFWGEFAERSSYYGMRAILSLYMIDKLGFSQGNAGTIITLFIAACYLLPLLGGWIADNFLGKYWTIVGFSLPYVIGQFLVGFPNPYVLAIALALLAMGSGVIKPNISTLMGLTYDQQRPKQELLRSEAFQMFYLAINIGAFLSQTTMPFLRNAYGYQVAFLFPAGLMILALTMFALGKPYYAVETITRTRLTPEQRSERWKVLGRIVGLFGLVMFFWAIFDQSTSTWIFFADTYMVCELFGFFVPADAIQAFNALFIITFLPLVMLFWRVLANRGIKVRPTDKMVAGFLLTALTMAIMAIAGMLAGPKEPTKRPKADRTKDTLVTRNLELAGGTGGVLESKVEPAAYAFQGQDRKTDVFSVRARVVNAEGKEEQTSFLSPVFWLIDDDAKDTPAGETVTRGDNKFVKLTEPMVIEKDGKKFVKQVVMEDWVRRENQVSVWWQVIAYLILTIAEILISVTGLELAFAAAPDSMKSFVTACWLVTVGIGNLVLNIPFTQIYPHMAPGPYFAMLTVMMLGVTGAFFFVAKRFNRMQAEAAAASPTS